MILCHDTTGKIYLTYNDPIPKGMEDVLTKNGVSFVHFKPKSGDIYGATVINHYYVLDGTVQDRPECPASVAVSGRVVTLADVPDGSSVIAILDMGTPFEHRETITDYTLEFDEPGTVKFAITPPFPFRERIYDVEIQ